MYLFIYSSFTDLTNITRAFTSLVFLFSIFSVTLASLQKLWRLIKLCLLTFILKRLVSTLFHLLTHTRIYSVIHECGHYWRSWFPRSLWSKKNNNNINIGPILNGYGGMGVFFKSSKPSCEPRVACRTTLSWTSWNTNSQRKVKLANRSVQNQAARLSNGRRLHFRKPA